MTVLLTKGQNVNLDKLSNGRLTKVRAGLGWDARTTGASGAAFDLDASAFLVDATGRVRTDKDFIFYNNLRSVSPDGAVVHSGDNLTGDGDGDDETLLIDLTLVSPDVAKVVFAVTIHDAASRRQNFGMVNNAFIRIVNDTTGEEVARYDLSEDYSVETGIIFGELYRHEGDWKFRAVGQGYQDGLAAIARNYGVNVG